MQQDQLFLFDLPPDSRRKKYFETLDRPLWTENKAKLIEKYLFYFKMVTRHGCYIDGFAGPQRPGQPELWAAKRVVENEPHWLRSFHLFERKERQIGYLRQLRESQPERLKNSIFLHTGDFNTEIHEFLKKRPIKESEATFCLLDQRTFDCHWSTLCALANYKMTGKKIELFYLLPNAWLDRALSALKKNIKGVVEWWGGDDWNKLRGMQPYPRAQLFCDRFKKELRYIWAYYWPIYEKRESTKIMYFMILATDHEHAPNLMNRAYNKALDVGEAFNQLKFDWEKWKQDRQLLSS